jgi:hypothetical protein
MKIHSVKVYCLPMNKTDLHYTVLHIPVTHNTLNWIVKFIVCTKRVNNLLFNYKPVSLLSVFHKTLEGYMQGSN